MIHLSWISCIDNELVVYYDSVDMVQARADVYSDSVSCIFAKLVHFIFQVWFIWKYQSSTTCSFFNYFCLLKFDSSYFSTDNELITQSESKQDVAIAIGHNFWSNRFLLSVVLCMLLKPKVLQLFKIFFFTIKVMWIQQKWKTCKEQIVFEWHCQVCLLPTHLLQTGIRPDQ